ncbi:MAG: flagellar hook-length control protein FliK, partial [Gaiellales bacterium]
MFNQPLSNSMSVAELAPKAATRASEPRRGDGAFGEALAGAKTVHDRRGSQVDRSRGDQPRSDQAAERTRSQGTERAAARGTDRSDRTSVSDKAGNARTSTSSTASRSDETTDATASSSTNVTANQDPAAGVIDAELAVTIEATDGQQEADTIATDAPAALMPTASATVAVAAAPVLAMDAIIVPTAAMKAMQHADDAVDAAIRLAITPAATTADAAAPAATVSTEQPDLVVEADGDAATTTLQPTKLAGSGTEDTETGDVQSPKRSLTSAPATTSGPSPTSTTSSTAATTATAATSAATNLAASAVAATPQLDAEAAVTATAAGVRADGAAQLVQAAAVTRDADAAPDTAGTASTKLAAAGMVDGEAALDAPDAAQPRLAVPNAATQPASPQAALQAQVYAQAQAKAAEQAGDDGGEAPAPKLDASTLQAQSLSAGRGDQIAQNTANIRDGLQVGASVQERIDHIAQQLATRLRLSQAAGGSQVQLSLKPRELGDVHVQMKVRDGQVAAVILVDKPETLRTMQSHIEELKRSLENQGLQIQEFSVDVRGEAGAGGANARAAADLNSFSGGRSGASN